MLILVEQDKRYELESYGSGKREHIRFEKTDQVVGYGILWEMIHKFLAAQICSAVAPSGRRGTIRNGLSEASETCDT